MFQTIKSKDAWNSPENSTDFPHCIFEIAHVDEAKKSFFCGLTVSHLDDTAEAEVVTFFEEVIRIDYWQWRNKNYALFETDSNKSYLSDFCIYEAYLALQAQKDLF